MAIDVAVYLSSLPRIADRNRKVDVLNYFAQGAKSQGAKVRIQNEYEILPARLAVILGWVGTKLSGRHIPLRQRVIEYQSTIGSQVMPIDSSCFKFVDPDSRFLRYSLGGVFYNTNNYANKNSTDAKWKQISNIFPALKLQPWRQNGNHILLCLQRDGGWSMKGEDLRQWAEDTVKRLRRISDRPILVRPHPRARIDIRNLTRYTNVYESDSNSSLQQDLRDAWASVFYNSSSSVASILAGVPVFAHDPDCVAWSVANNNINNIEDPSMPEREQWLWDLSACHWSDEESRDGTIYRHFRDHL